MATETKKKDKKYHGRCQCDRADIRKQSASLYINLENAAKLSVAIQSAIAEINRYNRGTEAGKRIGLLISAKSDKSVMVWHGDLRQPREKPAKAKAGVTKSANSN